MDFITATTHRPWELPTGPWVMKQTWQKLLFAHWPILPEALLSKLPAGLTLDTFNGNAWIGIVPFVLNYTFRGLHHFPMRLTFNELNVRTYVKVGNRAGVYFFSLDATDPLSVWGARQFYHLPYFNAQINMQLQDNGLIYCNSRRTHRGEKPALFEASYKPTSPVFFSQPGTLDHWLTERYCLYTADTKGALYAANIHHLPWPLQTAEATISQNTLTDSQEIILPNSQPILHYAERLEMVAWPLQKCN